MITPLRRIADPRLAPPTRVARALGLTVAVLVLLAAVVASSLSQAILFACAAGVATGVPVFYQLTHQRASRQEVRDLWGLSHLAVDGRPWPAPGGWALGADAIALITREMRERGSSTVVELGPGTSSVLLQAASAEPLEMYGLEHDERFMRVVASQLRMHGMDGYRLIHAPLKQRDHAGKTVTWYDERALDELPARIDVLIVDGPPNWKGKGNRAPAWVLLKDRLADNALVIVDDTFRPDERAMALGWVDANVSVLWAAETFVALEITGGVCRH